MTDKEKAKAYNEALKQATKELNTCGSLDCDAARQILRLFPQLRESEDEKIRKALIWHLKAGEDFVSNGVTKEQTIAWLEKQKEQPIDMPPGFYFIDLDGKKFYSKEFRYGDMKMKVAENEKEQNPKQEWSKEDEEALDMCLDAIPKKWKTKSGILLTKWLKDNIRFSWKPSEEQMEALQVAAMVSKTDFNTLTSLLADLKKL